MNVTYGPKTKLEHEFDEIVGRKWAKTSGQTQSILVFVSHEMVV